MKTEMLINMVLSVLFGMHTLAIVAVCIHFGSWLNCWPGLISAFFCWLAYTDESHGKDSVRTYVHGLIAKHK